MSFVLLISLQTFPSETATTFSNPLREVFEQNIPPVAVPKENTEELFNPEDALSEDFLNFINSDDPEILPTQNEIFPTREDLTDILLGDGFTASAEFQEISQISIDNFDESLFENIEEIEAAEAPNEVVINGMDEWLQVPPVIAFQVPAREQTEIPMTVIDHQSFTQPQSFIQSVGFKTFLNFLWNLLIFGKFLNLIYEVN